MPLGPASVPGVELAGSRSVMRTSTSFRRCLAEMLCTGVTKARVSSFRRLFAMKMRHPRSRTVSVEWPALDKWPSFTSNSTSPVVWKNTRDPVAVGWNPVQMREGGLAGAWGNGLFALPSGVTPPYLPPGGPDASLALWSVGKSSSARAGPAAGTPAQTSNAVHTRPRLARRFKSIPSHHKRGADDLANT